MGILGAIGGALKGVGGAIVKNIPIIGSVAGGVMDYMSQQHANQANAANVDKQIAFQKEQSSTQYQRGVADMSAAGLNPALAYQQGGDTAASGAAATAAPNTSNTSSKFAQALGVYNDLATGTAQRDLLRSQATAQDASAQLNQAQAAALLPDALFGRSFAPSLSGENNTNAQRYFKQRLSEMDAKTYGYQHEPERFQAAVNSLIGGTAQSYAAARESRTRATLNEQGYVNEAFRQYLPYVNTAKHITNIFSDITGALK